MDVALISTNRSKFSETFISNQVKLLPGEVHYLYGGYLPKYYGDNQLFSSNPDLDDHRKNIADYLIQNGIKAVLAHYGPSGVEMMDVCETANVPLVVHFHGYDAYRSDMLAAFGDRYQELFERVNAIIVVSQHMKEHLIKIGAPAEKINYTVCGADEELFEYHDAGNNPPTILSIGRFDETKGQHLSILAFKTVLEANPAARMIMVGDGHLLESCKLLARSLGLLEYIDFKGSLSHSEIAGLMGGVRVQVQHSITTFQNDTEGTPVAILEGGLSGLPIVSTYHGGIPDVIIDQETGFLTEEGEIEGTAKALIKLLEEPSLASQLGKAANLRIAEHFTLGKHIREVWSVIQSQVNQPETS